MDVLQPASLGDALAARAGAPHALAIRGGTDVMVELNFGRKRPETILDLSRVPDLAGWERAGDELRLGAGLTYERVARELADDLPGLAIASRTVGSPQIRNRGTIGGNLGSASPAGDAHPTLLACDADVELASQRGTRRVPVCDFFLGPKRNAAEPDELIVAVHVRRPGGPQQFAKVGPRNAMVIAVCSFAITLDLVARRVGTGIGSAGPTPLRARDAERFLEDLLTEERLWERPGPVPAAAGRRFGELVAAAARPIDDVRATAAYRRHALSVLATRTLAWTREAMPGRRTRGG
jgi:CO/xanthine dehydrogenase FAD-binding subunit